MWRRLFTWVACQCHTGVAFARHLALVLLSGHWSVRTSGTSSTERYTLANTPPADVVHICQWAVGAFDLLIMHGEPQGSPETRQPGRRPNVWPYGLEPALLPGIEPLPSPTCWLVLSFQRIAEFVHNEVEIPPSKPLVRNTRFYFIAPVWRHRTKGRHLIIPLLQKEGKMLLYKELEGGNKS